MTIATPIMLALSECMSARAMVDCTATAHLGMTLPTSITSSAQYLICQCIRRDNAAACLVQAHELWFQPSYAHSAAIMATPNPPMVTLADSE